MRPPQRYKLCSSFTPDRGPQEVTVGSLLWRGAGPRHRAVSPLLRSSNSGFFTNSCFWTPFTVGRTLRSLSRRSRKDWYATTLVTHTVMDRRKPRSSLWNSTRSPARRPPKKPLFSRPSTLFLLLCTRLNHGSERCLDMSGVLGGVRICSEGTDKSPNPLGGHPSFFARGH